MEALWVQRWRDSWCTCCSPGCGAKYIVFPCIKTAPQGHEQEWSVIDKRFPAKKIERSALLVNVAVYIHLSAVNRVPRKCTRICQRESNPADLVMQGEREAEKEDPAELRQVMVSARHGDWQYRNTWEIPDLSGITWMHSNSSHFQTKFSEDENSCEQHLTMNKMCLAWLYPVPHSVFALSS